MRKPNADLREQLRQQGGNSPVAAPPSQKTARPSRVGKVKIAGHFNPDVRLQLKDFCLHNNKTVQQALGEALNDYFAKHGLPEIVPVYQDR